MQEPIYCLYWMLQLDILKLKLKESKAQLTFENEHDHEWDNKSEATVFLHQNGKSDYVAQADGVAASLDLRLLRSVLVSSLCVCVCVCP